MEMRFNRNLPSETRGSLKLQKKLAETRRPANKVEQVPDLTDFMNDMFFGTVKTENKVYNLDGGGKFTDKDEDNYDDFDSSTRSTTSKLTQEWLEEAKRMVASSPTRGSESPSRPAGLPRFVAAPPRLSASTFDRRDPLSRSARRHRSAAEGFGGEIISKSAKHTRNNSDTFIAPHQPPPAADNSPASAVQKWFSNILKPPTLDPAPPPLAPRTSTAHRRSRFETADPPPPPVSGDPPRQSFHRKSRFQNDPNAAHAIPTHPTKRTFAAAGAPGPENTHLLSPPKHLVESVHRRSVSSSTWDNRVLSPPRNLVESAHRRSISSSTCATDRILQKPSVVNGPLKDTAGELGCKDLNGFLKEQKVKIEKILSGEIDGKAKIVLSGSSNSTSSMVAAICYAWLLENRMRNSKDGVEEDGRMVVVVPVLNVRRGKMWKQRQAAWLFHHVGVDASALLFSDEVELETLMMAKQLSMLVVGQDILRTNGEVGSQCTILTDNYCEDAYDILQTPVLKKLMLAGILLDTQNLNMSSKLSMTRDAEAVQLLSVGSAPNYGNDLYDQLMQDQKDGNFYEILRHNYGKPPDESKLLSCSKGSIGSRASVEHRYPEKSYTEAIVTNSKKTSNHVKGGQTGKVTSKSGVDMD
ncbi:hypothetical protein RJ639_025552 [Escallonia herrerae]|uniref:Uncharacterized protein n=1 Tax=Escallonia herrerae TaxID=1293975 RepID=A0AA89AC66_9ASTE|nr:hypothetical protein RJ639_025552 [Escallonia herrerae]